ncbi:MAG: methionyl-tRNA formyltransferase [Lachnospiraceae bacterium]|nr:methionyl-tRNA formyltransferase [Lachnospiraceae bacterium]
MKVLFMGTPDFAVSILDAIAGSSHEVVGVVTQEDKPKGRSDKLVAPPVKECALRHGIPVFQPHRIKTPEAVSGLRQFDADIFVVSAYGQILSKEILDMPRYGCINTHASLLPKYRGAAPIQWAILSGDEKTGVTIMQMDEGVDTGDILFTSEVNITPKETGESLFDKLAVSGASLIVEALDKIEQGDITPIKQNEAEATHVGMLNKKMGELDFGKTAAELDRLIRAFTPWPGAYTYLNGKILKVHEADAVSDNELLSSCPGSGDPVPAGCIAGVSKDGIYIKTGDGCLKVTELQLEGKKRMKAADFLAGCRLTAGERLT